MCGGVVRGSEVLFFWLQGKGFSRSWVWFDFWSRGIFTDIGGVFSRYGGTFQYKGTIFNDRRRFFFLLALFFLGAHFPFFRPSSFWFFRARFLSRCRCNFFLIMAPFQKGSLTFYSKSTPYLYQKLSTPQKNSHTPTFKDQDKAIHLRKLTPTPLLLHYKLSNYVNI